VRSKVASTSTASDEDDRYLRILAIASRSPRGRNPPRASARAGRAAAKRRAAGPAPIVFQLALAARRCLAQNEKGGR
jgi:hypothetical protein